MSKSLLTGNMIDKLRSLAADNRAVSPVIGVILMVAITVILAAVIGTFIIGLGDNIETNVQAGATVNEIPSDDRVAFAFNSNQNADYLELTVTDEQGQSVVYELGSVGSKVVLYATGSGSVTDETLSGDVTADSSNTLESNSGETDNFNLVAGSDTDLSVTITAHKGQQSTTIISEEISV